MDPVALDALTSWHSKREASPGFTCKAALREAALLRGAFLGLARELELFLEPFVTAALVPRRSEVEAALEFSCGAALSLKSGSDRVGGQGGFVEPVVVAISTSWSAETETALELPCEDAERGVALLPVAVLK